jgi:hypothetical protein
VAPKHVGGHAVEPRKDRWLVECDLTSAPPGFEEHQGRDVLGCRGVGSAAPGEAVDPFAMAFEQLAEGIRIVVPDTPPKVGVGWMVHGQLLQVGSVDPLMTVRVVRFATKRNSRARAGS